MTPPASEQILRDVRPDGTSLDVVGIGNALVDVLSHEDDDFVRANDLVKGAMTLIETERATELYDAMGPGIEVSGGSAANTVAGVASFGGRAAYLGKVADDQLGLVFGHDMRANGVLFRSPLAADGPPTGRCLIVVTPDAERTMNTYLGASAHFGPEDVDAELVEAARYTFLEGYLFDRPEAKSAYRKASEIAHGAGRKVALTLSDTFCVERHVDEWRSLVVDQVDVLFANDAELRALYDVHLDAAVERARDEVEITCVTLGAEGSLIVTSEGTIEVPPEPVKVVDTTGAGDLYAAGVLHGLAGGLPLAECGRLGSVAASAVIGHTGARPGQSLAQLA
ncbi:MAG TPA: adenosine kinase [Acidimicrobiales bacterium]|nr:adenosine kinase [Acidimicrobiales bacterium]